MKLTIEARTDVGLVRELNEDSYRVLPDKNAVVVCDGMGGHAAGEIASATAADSISDVVSEGLNEHTGTISPLIEKPWPEEAAMLAGAVRLANRRLYNEASRSHKLRGMGTTVVAALFARGTIATAHVGDSRAYRITADGIEQLTTDHSWVAELIESGQVKPEDAESFADKNVITRALGTRPGVQVDLAVHPATAGELYLLCSDGLCGYVSDADILKYVQTHSDDLGAAAAALIDAANSAGGLDNSTVALIRVEDTDQASAPLDPGSITLPEENESELSSLDALIASRYREEAPRGGEDETDVQPSTEPESEAEGRGGFGWRWAIVLFLLAILALVVFWPRSETDDSGGSATSDQTAPAPAEAVAAEDLALLFIAAGSADRSARVFWDGVEQGTLTDLELGLLVDPGRHRLDVVSAEGDTLFTRKLDVAARDTLDLLVQ